jgi:hypothetical protein
MASGCTCSNDRNLDDFDMTVEALKYRSWSWRPGIWHEACMHNPQICIRLGPIGSCRPITGITDPITRHLHYPTCIKGMWSYPRLIYRKLGYGLCVVSGRKDGRSIFNSCPTPIIQRFSFRRTGRDLISDTGIQTQTVPIREGLKNAKCVRWNSILCIMKIWNAGLV